MSCINVKVSAEPGIVVSTAMLGNPTIVKVSQIEDTLKVLVNKLWNFNVTTTCLNTPLKVRGGLVCSIDLAHKYIVVDEGPIWLTQLNDYSSDVVVYSNTEWRIEY